MPSDAWSRRGRCISGSPSGLGGGIAGGSCVHGGFHPTCNCGSRPSGEAWRGIVRIDVLMGRQHAVDQDGVDQASNSLLLVVLEFTNHLADSTTLLGSQHKY